MKKAKSFMPIITIAMSCFMVLCICSCAECENTTTENPPMEGKDYYHESLTAEQKEIFSGVVTLEMLESVVGKLTYEYTPPSSAYTIHVYKRTDQQKYELESAGYSLEGVLGEIVTCRVSADDDHSTLMFCKTSSRQYWIFAIWDRMTP